MLSELQLLHDPRVVGIDRILARGCEGSVQPLLQSVSGDAIPSGSERILLVAFCSNCGAQVIRKFDLEGIELVIQPWEHRYPRTDHGVADVEIDDPRADRI